MAKPAVMFVCVKNGGKSQMAGALMRQAMGDLVEVHTAGTAPGSSLNAQSVAALAELGASVHGEQPKPLDTALLRRMDLTVVLGEEATVRPVPGMSGPIETWITDEPGERGIAGMERMRLVRDDIKARVDELAGDLRAVLGLPEGREPGAALDPETGAPVCRD